MTISATQALLKPWFDAISAVGITAPLTFNHYPSFLLAWKRISPKKGSPLPETEMRECNAVQHYV